MLHESIFDGRLNYARGPDSGPPLVLLHGVLRCWQDFSPLIPSLLPRWQVLALDHRGHGRSANDPQGGYLVVDYVKDAGDFLRQFAGEPAIVYGHSLGAMVAAKVAAENPDRVRAVILEDPPLDTMGSRIRQTVFHDYFTALQQAVHLGLDVPELARAIGKIEIDSPIDKAKVRLRDVRDGPSLRFSAKCLTHVDPRVFDSILATRWLDGFDQVATFAAVRCPTLLLQADVSSGGMLSDADAELMEETIGECCRIKFAGVGHLIHWLRTEKTLRLVNGFIESL